MHLNQLIKSVETVLVNRTVDDSLDNTIVSGLEYDSRKIKDGDIFFCIRGLKEDGHSYGRKAQDAGAKALVVERILDDIDIPQIHVTDSRIAMARMASMFYGNPTSKMLLIGVTGTNGKTTSCFMIDSILRAAGHTTGLLGTIEYRIGDERVEVSRTTPESLDLQQLFVRMIEKGVTAAVMEVSSHAIDLSRIEACEFNVLAFTNLSQDHLDYHNTIEDYFSVKRRIFDSTVGSAVTHVINVDDEYGKSIVADDHSSYLRYSTKEKLEVYANSLNLSTDGTDFRLNTQQAYVNLHIKMPGIYNVYNAMAAAGCAIALNIGLDKVKEGLEGIENVPGRFERVDIGQTFTIIVDYAHTPDSIEKVLQASRELTEGKLIIVFGCGGDRDKGKRPIMGSIASELSDLAIITSDNPRSEKPEAIIEDIVDGIKKSGKDNYIVEVDRRNAIRRAIELADEGDFIVIAGKGHESGQQIGKEIIPFDDVEVTKKTLMEFI